jgi:23S rRNA (adenine-N6)-dimethyltransferase
VGAQRPRRSPASPGRGQHFLSPRLAADLVRRFDIREHEVVVEIGAGSGRLTRELASSAGLVLAVEVDQRLAQRLTRASASWPNVYVHAGDARDAAFPTVPHRVVGNVPFSITTALLRRVVDDPDAQKLDLVLQLEAARKRARPWGSALSVLWHVQWRFEVRAVIPARAFHPMPGVEAAWLAGARRQHPLVAPAEMPALERLVRRGFERADLPVRRSLDLPRSALERAGIPRDARAVDLNVEQWVSIFQGART